MTYCFISIVFLSSLIIRLAQSLNIYFLITFSRPLSNPKHSHRNRLDSIRPTNLYLLFVFFPRSVASGARVKLQTETRPEVHKRIGNAEIGERPLTHDCMAGCGAINFTATRYVVRNTLRPLLITTATAKRCRRDAVETPAFGSRMAWSNGSKYTKVCNCNERGLQLIQATKKHFNVL